MSERLSLLLRHPLARMLSASLAMFLALAISFAATEALVPKHSRANWPNAVAALAGALGYWAYARWLECRQVTGLDGHGARGDSARGIALGGLLALLALAPLWGWVSTESTAGAKAPGSLPKCQRCSSLRCWRNC